MSQKKASLEDRFDDVIKILLIQDDDERVKAIEAEMMASGNLTYHDPIWNRHFKHADMFKQSKRPVDPETGQYFGKIYY